MKKVRAANIVMLILLFAVGVFFRLWHLGQCPFGSDAMDFYRYALADKSIMSLWMNPPWLNQIPLNETFTLVLIKLGLPATPFVTRLPFALMGIVTLFLMWRFARTEFGMGAAICVLILSVFNPFHLYYSRTAYHYAGATCWSAAMFMVFWRVREYLVSAKCPPMKLMLLWTVTAIVACHMHMSVWIVAGLQGLVIFVMGLVFLRQDRRVLLRHILLAVGSGVLLASVMSRWIYRAVLQVERVGAEGGFIGSPMKMVIKRLFPALFAGESCAAMLLLAVIFVLALSGLIIAVRKHKSFGALSWIAILHVSFLLGYIAVAGSGVAKVTYFSPVWPLFIWFLGVGIWEGSAAVAAGRKWARYSVIVMLLCCYIALTLLPLWAIVNLEGKRMPTYKIDSWAMKNVPAGTPILVDRWLHPWNELAIHNTNQINYTFTVPDEPLATFRALRWRETATAFLEKYPQAAFLEVRPGAYYKQVGSWSFPERHFPRVVSITNAPMVVLQKSCVYPLGRFALEGSSKYYSYRIFYNTTDDILASARKKNQKTLRLFGDRWRYLKPWQPMRSWPEQLTQMLWMQAGMYADGGKTVRSMAELQSVWQARASQYINQGRWADYRVPSSRSSLRLFNLKDQKVQAKLSVVGFPLSGDVRCRIGASDVLFPQGLMSERSVTLDLAPGETQLLLSVPANQLLLVHDVRLETEPQTR